MRTKEKKIKQQFDELYNASTINYAELIQSQMDIVYSDYMRGVITLEQCTEEMNVIEAKARKIAEAKIEKLEKAVFKEAEEENNVGINTN